MSRRMKPRDPQLDSSLDRLLQGMAVSPLPRDFAKNIAGKAMANAQWRPDPWQDRLQQWAERWFGNLTYAMPVKAAVFASLAMLGYLTGLALPPAGDASLVANDDVAREVMIGETEYERWLMENGDV